MIRKTIAFIILFCVLIFLSAGIVLQSFLSSLLSESVVREKIIPQSYDYIDELLVERFASDSAVDASVMRDRLQTLMPRDIYIELLTTFSNKFFKAVDLWKAERASTRNLGFEIDVGDMKARIKEIAMARFHALPVCGQDEPVDSFRFCKPTHEAPLRALKTKEFALANPALNIAEVEANKSSATSDLPSEEEAEFKKNMASFLDKAIPPHVVLFNKENVQAQKAFEIFLDIRDYLILAIVGLFVFVLLVVSALCTPPWKAILKWVSGFGMTLGLFLGVFATILSGIDDVSRQIFSGLKSSQIDFAGFLLHQPLSFLWLWAFLIFGCSVLLFATRFIITKK